VFVKAKPYMMIVYVYHVYIHTIHDVCAYVLKFSKVQLCKKKLWWKIKK